MYAAKAGWTVPFRSNLADALIQSIHAANDR